ncbi:MAG: hypothetical protein JXR60_03910 [Bacteroidales bacterium]|nr:hypothetical protein [Bacteroidales bacterium]
MLKKQLSILILFTSFTLLGQNSNNFITNGTPILRVFAKYSSNLGGNSTIEPYEGMELSRAYLGYKAQIDSSFHVKLVMDVENKTGRFDTYLKNASLSYNKNQFEINIGLISTTQFAIQEKTWGHRYIQKSYQDQYKYNSSADLGVSIFYNFKPWLNLDFIFQNGEGYKNVDPTGTYRGGFGLTVKILKSITYRAYYDFSIKTDISRENYATFIAYNFKKTFSIGAEFNYQKNNNFIENHNLYGYSIFSTYNYNNHWSIIARYDNSMSNTITTDLTRIEPQPWNANRDEQMIFAGIQYKLSNKVATSINYRRTLSAVRYSDWLNWFFINIEFKL